MAEQTQDGAAGWRRPVRRLIDAATSLAELVLVAMLAVIGLEVVLRSSIGYSLQFADEVSAYLLVALTFLGLSISLHDGALFRVEFVFGRLGPRLRAAVELLFNLAGLGFAVLLEYQLCRQVVSTWHQEMVAPTLLATPLWLPQAAMPLGGLLLIVVLLAEVADSGLRLVGRAGGEGRP